ncbi:MAG: aminotransferase class V-fold PLP-dependent enzyme [Corynebacterium sp.]|nr:aminotransferase class V-fold PLP-dependent enzyme [Corynebacterium sp.]
MDVASVRGLYAGLSDGWTYLNAHDAPQIAERVSAAVARSFRMAPSVAADEGPSGSHSASPAAGRLERDGLRRQAEMAVADLAGVTSGCVVLGPSLDVLYAKLAACLQPLLRRNSSIVQQRLGAFDFSHLGAQVRWAQPDLGTGELPAYQFAELIDGSTRLVAFHAADPVLGSVADVTEIAATVRAHSRAWTLVDVSALAPYRSVDIAQLGVDIIGVDMAQLGGPDIAALVFRTPAMLERLHVTRAELASPVSAGLAGGVAATVDHLASFGADSSSGTALQGRRDSRRTRLHNSLAELSRYTDSLRDDLYALLGTLPAVHIVGVTGEAALGANTANRIPRLSFAVRGVPAATVHQRLFGNGLVTTLTPPSPLLVEMGLDELGGAITVALGPFNTFADIEHLTRVVASLA